MWATSVVWTCVRSSWYFHQFSSDSLNSDSYLFFIIGLGATILAQVSVHLVKRNASYDVLIPSAELLADSPALRAR